MSLSECKGIAFDRDNWLRTIEEAATGNQPSGLWSLTRQVLALQETLLKETGVQQPPNHRNRDLPPENSAGRWFVESARVILSTILDSDATVATRCIACEVLAALLQPSLTLGQSKAKQIAARIAQLHTMIFFPRRFDGSRKRRRGRRGRRGANKDTGHFNSLLTTAETSPSFELRKAVNQVMHAAVELEANIASGVYPGVRLPEDDSCLYGGFDELLDRLSAESDKLDQLKPRQASSPAMKACVSNLENLLRSLHECISDKVSGLGTEPTTPSGSDYEDESEPVFEPEDFSELIAIVGDIVRKPHKICPSFSLHVAAIQVLCDLVDCGLTYEDVGKEGAADISACIALAWNTNIEDEAIRARVRGAVYALLHSIDMMPPLTHYIMKRYATKLFGLVDEERAYCSSKLSTGLVDVTYLVKFFDTFQYCPNEGPLFSEVADHWKDLLNLVFVAVQLDFNSLEDRLWQWGLYSGGQIESSRRRPQGEDSGHIPDAAEDLIRSLAMDVDIGREVKAYLRTFFVDTIRNALDAGPEANLADVNLVCALGPGWLSYWTECPDIMPLASAVFDKQAARRIEAPARLRRLLLYLLSAVLEDPAYNRAAHAAEVDAFHTWAHAALFDSETAVAGAAFLDKHGHLADMATDELGFQLLANAMTQCDPVAHCNLISTVHVWPTSASAAFVTLFAHEMLLAKQMLSVMSGLGVPTVTVDDLFPGNTSFETFAGALEGQTDGQLRPHFHADLLRSLRLQTRTIRVEYHSLRRVLDLLSAFISCISSVASSQSVPWNLALAFGAAELQLPGSFNPQHVSTVEVSVPCLPDELQQFSGDRFVDASREEQKVERPQDTIRKLVLAFHKQLMQGCGAQNCSQPYCRSNPLQEVLQRAPALKLALRLARSKQTPHIQLSDVQVALSWKDYVRRQNTVGLLLSRSLSEIVLVATDLSVLPASRDVIPLLDFDKLCWSALHHQDDRAMKCTVQLILSIKSSDVGDTLLKTDVLHGVRKMVEKGSLRSQFALLSAINSQDDMKWPEHMLPTLQGLLQLCLAPIIRACQSTEILDDDAEVSNVDLDYVEDAELTQDLLFENCADATRLMLQCDVSLLINRSEVEQCSKLRSTIQYLEQVLQIGETLASSAASQLACVELLSDITYQCQRIVETLFARFIPNGEKYEKVRGAFPYADLRFLIEGSFRNANTTLRLSRFPDVQLSYEEEFGQGDPVVLQYLDWIMACTSDEVSTRLSSPDGSRHRQAIFYFGRTTLAPFVDVDGPGEMIVLLMNATLGHRGELLDYMFDHKVRFKDPLPNNVLAAAKEWIHEEVDQLEVPLNFILTDCAFDITYGTLCMAVLHAQIDAWDPQTASPTVLAVAKTLALRSCPHINYLYQTLPSLKETVLQAHRDIKLTFAMGFHEAAGRDSALTVLVHDVQMDINVFLIVFEFLFGSPLEE